MEKNNGKIVAVAALIVAVVALSVGFAAFADTLTINGTATAKVSNNNPFDAGANNDLRYKTGTATCVTNDQDEENVVTGSPYNVGTLTEDSWAGISVPLTAAHPSVKCTAQVENKNAYKAWLRKITASSGISCSSNGANATANANSVCATVTASAQFGVVDNDKIEFSGTTKPADVTSTTGSIDANADSTVTVIITYVPANVVADEDVTITIPTISHIYSTAQNGATGE